MEMTIKNEYGIFSELETLCTSPGYIHVLARLVFENNFHVGETDEFYPDIDGLYSLEKLNRNELSLLHGLMLKGALDSQKLELPEIQAKRKLTYELLKGLHDDYLSKASRGFFETTVKNGLFSDKHIIQESIFYAAESCFDFQQLAFSIDRYKKDNEWLESKVGFSIEEAARIIEAIKVSLHINAQAYANGLIGDCLETMALPVFAFRSSDLAHMTSIKIEKVRAFLIAFGVPSSPTNEQYVAFNEYNLAKSKPIIRVNDEEFYLFQIYSLCESLYTSPIFWMQADKPYRSIASDHRGQYLESVVAERLQCVFDANTVYKNVDIYKGKNKLGEIDVLVIHADRAIIIQAKSKTLTLKSQQGDVVHLKDDFKKAIQDAYDQALQCADLINNDDITLKLATGEVIKPPSFFQEILPICIVADHYPSLYFQAREFLKTKKRENLSQPYVMDIFLLDVMCEFLSSPIRFLDYVNKRTGYNDSMIGNNDFSILGYHLKNNLYMDGDYNMMMLEDDIAYDLDKAFSARRLQGKQSAIPKGILTAFIDTPYGKIIDELSNLKEAFAIDLGYLLLSFNGETINAFNNAVTQLTRQALKSGRVHDFTLGFEIGGLTFHIAKEPSESRYSLLQKHAKLRKYTAKADKWFGLSMTAGKGAPLDLMCAFLYPWKFDKKMEQRAEAMPIRPKKSLPQSGNIARSSKLGVNDPCHCGSGKKYKKCCLK